ncbi:hypothetical protein EJ04DRAFT_507961 [Polyplosphaeria fusca]|uniref:Uncharacterized protein n=1 Tax=Polyplosphaeria fusca TaxID=682080 RepID=A0A9P4V5A8_9PLEO|nr:hypothetical protein EJ04DRAFT_507961 [Polyplosphaeria fusca]
MCLVKVREEEEVRIPNRVVVRTRSVSPVRRRSVQRVSRDVVRESRESREFREARPSPSYVSIPAPRTIPIPTPQPVPVFVEPPPAPLPPPPPSTHHHHGHHYVEVSPRSSVSSHSPSRASDYVVREREYRRERNYSPESSPRYESFRYVEPPPSESDRYEHYVRRERSRSRARSRDRDYGGYDGRGSFRETRERVVIVDDDGHRRREYRR